MQIKRLVILALTFFALTGCGTPKYCKPMFEHNRAVMAEKTDDTMGWIVTALSQMRWAGRSCNCPEDTDVDGHKCGERSAYTRSGGASVYCYSNEVPQWKKQEARNYGAVLALPQECGGAGDPQILNFMNP